MAFLRMILPAWLAGLYAALLLSFLVLFLNPDTPLTLPTLAGLLPMAFLLSLPVALVWPLSYRFLRLFARRRLRVGRMSFKYLYGFACADLFLVSALYSVNAGLMEVMIPPAALERLRLASALLTGATLLFLAAVAVPAFRRRRMVRGACHLLALLLPPVLLLIRPGFHAAPAPRYTSELVRPSPSAPRILVLGIEGATLDQVLPLASQGKLPWFSRLLQQGAHGRLIPFRPCLAPVVWQSLWTGKLPYKHRILDFDRYLLPGSSREIRLAPRGFGFRRLAGVCGLARQEQQSGESGALTVAEIVSRLGSDVRVIGPERGQPLPAAGSEVPDIRPERFLDPEQPVPRHTRSLPVSLRRAVEGDQAVAAAGLAAWRKGEAKMVIVVLPGLDRVSHLFLKYGMPAGFGDVPPEEVEIYGSVLERYYRFLDDWLGMFLEGEGPPAGAGAGGGGSLFLVVSPHGVEPMPLARRFAARLEGNRLDSGYHDRGPDGLILASGKGIRHGVPLGKASVLDVAPTLLYYLGLPSGMDMDGHALTRLFDSGFTSENPILLIPSYEASRVALPANRRPGTRAP